MHWLTRCRVIMAKERRILDIKIYAGCIFFGIILFLFNANSNNYVPLNIISGILVFGGIICLVDAWINGRTRLQMITAIFHEPIRFVFDIILKIIFIPRKISRKFNTKNTQ